MAANSSHSPSLENEKLPTKPAPKPKSRGFFSSKSKHDPEDAQDDEKPTDVAIPDGSVPAAKKIEPVSIAQLFRSVPLPSCSPYSPSDPPQSKVLDKV